MRRLLEETQRNIKAAMTAQIIPIPLIDCMFLGYFSVKCALLRGTRALKALIRTLMDVIGLKADMFQL